MENKHVPRALYLHGGPGSNACAERLWFGNALSIDWWDQPSAQARGEDAFPFIVDAAEHRLRTLCEHAGQGIHLVAHSFGATIATELTRSHGAWIASVTLLTPTFDLFSALRQLARWLDAKGLRNPA